MKTENKNWYGAAILIIGLNLVIGVNIGEMTIIGNIVVVLFSVTMVIGLYLLTRQ